MCLLLQNGPKYRRYWYVNSGAQRCSIVVDQHNVVAVKFRNFGLLVLLEANQNALFLFAFDGHQHSITDVADRLFVVHMDDPRWLSFGHRSFADFTVVHHTETGQFADFIANGGGVQLMGLQGAGLTDWH